MKNKIGFIVDSTFTLDADFITKYHVKVAKLAVLVNGEEVTEVTNKQIDKWLENGDKVTTSQPPVGVFAGFYDELIAEGCEKIAVFTLPSTLSGTYNGAVTAKKLISTPERDSDIVVIDSKTGSCGSAFIFKTFVEYLEAGMSFAEAVLKINDYTNHGKFMFIIDSLKTLKQNGRLGLIKYIVSKLLHLKPILSFKNNSLKLEKGAIVGYHRAKEYFLKTIEKYITAHPEKKIYVRIEAGNAREKGLDLEKTIKEQFPSVDTVYQGEISTIFQVHCGPGGIAMYVNAK